MNDAQTDPTRPEADASAKLDAHTGGKPPNAQGPGGRGAGSRNARSRAREFALQALYQHLVGRNDAASIDAFTRDLSGFHKADSVHYDALLHGCVNAHAEFDAAIAPALDRPVAELSPIEHAVMWIGLYELRHCPDVPWRVVLNECIELAKAFGGTDGHKYVNAVLNRLAATERSGEVSADPMRRPPRASRQPG